MSLIEVSVRIDVVAGVGVDCMYCIHYFVGIDDADDMDSDVDIDLVALNVAVCCDC